MKTLFFCIIADMFVQFILLFLFYRTYRNIRILQGKDKSRRAIRFVNKKILRFMQISSVLIVFMLSYIVSYESSNHSFARVLIMFALYLFMPMHGGILALSIWIDAIYKKALKKWHAGT